jgi:hypothetical protein
VTKYVLLYLGGTAPQTPEEGEKATADWLAWFGKVGDRVVETGNAFGSSFTVGDAGASGVSGYTAISADSADEAKTLLDGHPHLKSGGSIEVHEALEM